MIITKTPLRMSFVGGGSDLPSYYREHGGAVLTTAIQKYVYLIVKSRFEKGYRGSYSKTEQTIFINDIKHPLVRGALRMLDIDEDLEIISAADIPSSGSGLGSSSSFSVGLINALLKYKNKKVLLKNIYNSITNPDSFKSNYLSEIKPLIKSNIINKACLKELIHGVMLDTKKK